MSPRPTAPPDAAAPGVPRSPWARRWVLVALALTLAWTALAWWLNERRFDDRVGRAVGAATAQATARAVLVDDGLRDGLAQLGGVARVLARTPAAAQALRAAGDAARASAEPVAVLRERLLHVPDIAAMNAFLAVSADELGADLIYLLDEEGNCVAASNAGTSGSVVGQHLVEDQFFDQTRIRGGTRQFAVGRATGIPGLYFSAAIPAQGRFLGAVVVKRNTPALAAMVGHEGAFVVDAQGVVIMAQDPRLQLQALENAPVFALEPAERVARYQHDRLPVLRIVPWGGPGGAALRLVGNDPTPQVVVQRHMAGDALDVYVAQPVPEIEALVRERLAIFVLLALAGAGGIAIVAAGLGGWRSRRSVLDALQHAALANQHLSIEIAERQRAEALLRESREYLLVHEARLRALLRSLPEQVWMKDRAGAYLAVNAEFERFQGLKEVEILGKSDHDLASAERAARFDEQDRATLAAPEPLSSTTPTSPRLAAARASSRSRRPRCATTAAR